MKESDTLFDSKISEPLVNSNQPISENTHNNMGENKIVFSPNQSDKASIKVRFGINLLIFLFVLCFILLFLFFIFQEEIYMAGFLIFLFYFIINSLFLTTKIEVSKLNNMINVYTKNFYNCYKVILLSGNIHFYKSSNGNEKNPIPYLFFINDSNNDLDTVNIKKGPSKLFYLLEGIDELEVDYLMDMFEVNNFDNPLLFDIAKYTGKNRNILENNPQQIISKVMKFGEHFFTLYLISPSPNRILYNTFSLGILFIFNFPIIIFCLIYFYHYIDLTSSEIFFRFSILIAIDLIIFLFLINFKSQDSRIDFIYSKGFDKIFIGIIKNSEYVYFKTFEYNLNEVEKFIFQQPESNDGNYTFKVSLKNKAIEEIIQFKGIEKTDLEGLEYILNGKLNN